MKKLFLQFLQSMDLSKSHGLSGGLEKTGLRDLLRDNSFVHKLI